VFTKSGEPEQSPGNNALEHDVVLQPFRIPKLRLLGRTAGLEDLVKDLDVPAPRILMHLLDRLFGARHRQVGDQYPAQGVLEITLVRPCARLAESLSNSQSPVFSS